MGKGNRGFKPQGIANPIVLARLNRPQPSGPCVRDRLFREDRPSWDDLKNVVCKKEKASSEHLEKWENDIYRKELETIRNLKRKRQERQDLKELEKKHKKKNINEELSSNSSIKESPSKKKKHHGDKSPKENDTKVTLDYSAENVSEKGHKIHHKSKSHKHRSKHKKKSSKHNSEESSQSPLNLHKLSNFFKMASHIRKPI